MWKHPILSRFVPPRRLQARSVRREMSPVEDFVHISSARSAKQLADRGVYVNTGAHGQREGLGSHWEIWSLVLGGMTPLEALYAATLSPAGHLGMDGDLGSIEAGKLADLFVVDGNPVADIRDTDNIALVMLNGRLYDAKTLNEQVTGNHQNQPYFWYDDGE